MKTKTLNEMMAYLTRPGFNGGGYVKKESFEPKKNQQKKLRKEKE